MSKLKVTKVLTTAALLSALAIILGLFKLPISDLMEIRFTMIPIGIAGGLLGPGVGAVVGIIADIGGYIVHPTGAFMPLFTLTNALSGAAYGLVLYKNPNSWARLFIANAIRSILFGIVLNSLWLAILYGYGFIPTMLARVPQQLILIPVYSVIMKALMPLSMRLYDSNAVGLRTES